MDLIFSVRAAFRTSRQGMLYLGLQQLLHVAIRAQHILAHHSKVDVATQGAGHWQYSATSGMDDGIDVCAVGVVALAAQGAWRYGLHASTDARPVNALAKDDCSSLLGRSTTCQAK